MGNRRDQRRRRHRGDRRVLAAATTWRLRGATISLAWMRGPILRGGCAGHHRAFACAHMSINT
jgi:hypothetical protein